MAKSDYGRDMYRQLTEVMARLEKVEETSRETDRKQGTQGIVKHTIFAEISQFLLRKSPLNFTQPRPNSFVEIYQNIFVQNKKLG